MKLPSASVPVALHLVFISQIVLLVVVVVVVVVVVISNSFSSLSWILLCSIFQNASDNVEFNNLDSSKYVLTS